MLISAKIEVLCPVFSTDKFFKSIFNIMRLLTPGNDRGVTPHSVGQSNQFRSRALWSIEHERVHDFHSKQFPCQQPFN